MAQEWIELLERRTRTSKTRRLHKDGQPTRKYSWDGQVGVSKHYEDALGAWQDVGYDEEPDTDGFTVKFTKLSYFGRIDNEGRRRFYPDRNDLSYWIEFKKPYPSMGAPTRHNRWWYWDFAHATFGLRFDVDSLKFGFRLKRAQAPHSITIPFETQGITRQGRLLYHDGEVVAELRKPIAIGSNFDVEGLPVQKECDVLFAPGEVTISLDPSGLEYPIDIDPTVDVQIGANANDGMCYEIDKWYENYIYFGKNQAVSRNAWMLWDVDVAQGVTIDVATISVKCKAGRTDDINTKFWGNDIDNASPPTSLADYLSKDKTTASVDFDFTTDTVTGTWYNNIVSIVSIIQEIIDRPGWSLGNNLQVFNEDDGSGTNLYQKWQDYNDAPADAAKLHIEYTAAAAAVGFGIVV